MKFTDLLLKKELLDTLTQMGFEEPTPIQQRAIPLALQGKDLIGQAQTGTGKTAAFGLPLLQHLDRNQSAIQGLVVTPTRELAIQVQEELYRLGKGVRARVYVVYGGTSLSKQIERIKRQQPQIIVGTPGRLLDLIQRKVLKFNHLQTLVLDEADEMLNMGFIEDIKVIIQATPKNRQTLLFSATMPSAIRNLSGQFLIQPELVKIEAQSMTADLVEQYFTKCRDDEKFDLLTRFLDVQTPKQAIIFCRTKKRVDEVGRGLSLRGYQAEMIHGDITQQKRTSVINAFRKEEVELLVATDVAARGLDISGVTHVYNYDISQDPESYVHRIGRTGRAGNEGISLTLVQPNEMAYLREIEQLIGKQMLPMRPPTLQEAQHQQVQTIIDQVNDQLAKGQVDPHRNTAKILLAHYPANDLVAALLDQLIIDNQQIPVSISPQKPLPKAKRKQSSQDYAKDKRSRGRKKSHHKPRGERRRQTSGSKRGSQGVKQQFKIKKNKAKDA